jgi:hypothetical protein
MATGIKAGISYGEDGAQQVRPAMPHPIFILAARYPGLFGRGIQQAKPAAEVFERAGVTLVIGVLGIP